MSYEVVHSVADDEHSPSVDAVVLPQSPPPVPLVEATNQDNNDRHHDDDESQAGTGSQARVEAVAKRITRFDAVMHLMKGNLGPGCLNLPHAFALSGWLLGLCLFALVVAQGLYSMWLLVYCKGLLRDKNARTFMDVARFALGPAGGRLVQTFLFVLQAGVCCVFLSLISTNLQAQAGLTDVTSIACVTFVLLFMVLLRFIKDLRWLSATANCFMMIAISTAAISGWAEIWSDPQRAPAKRSTSSAEEIATFVSSMFFSFEGIGLVLPVENSFTVGFADPAEERRASHRFQNVLVGAMSAVAALFAWIGLSASVGYPDIHNGSVTAYLERHHPDNPWYGIVNSLVMLAVLLTFPLQLTPAMEVLDEWCAPGCTPSCFADKNTSTSTDDISSLMEDCPNEEDLPERGIENEHPIVIVPDGIRPSCCACRKREWVFRRWLVVLGCASVVVLVDDLALLMSLFGAIGQTGLALLPCVVHLSLVRSGVAPRNVLRSAVDGFVIAFSVAVMIAGCVFSVREIVKKKGGDPER